MEVQESFTCTCFLKKEVRMNSETKHIAETCYFPVELFVPGPGANVEINQALPLLYELAEGVTVLNPAGIDFRGTLKLSVAGEEVFPNGFHVRAYMYTQSSHSNDAIINRELDSHIYPFKEKAKGSTIKACYKEPSNGQKGMLYLVFKLTRTKPCP